MNRIDRIILNILLILSKSLGFGYAGLGVDAFIQIFDAPVLY